MHLFHYKPKRTLLVLLLALFCSTVRGQSISQPLTLNLRNTNLSEVLGALDRQTPFIFSYDPAGLRKISIKDISYRSLPLHDILTDLKNRTGLEYAVQQNTIAFKLGTRPVVALTKASGTVAGKVVDEENGEPVAGVTILIGDRGTATDMNGGFTLSLPAGKYTAIISSVGYGSKEVSEIDVYDGQVFDLNVTLRREKGSLGGVTVKASARKESVRSLLLTQKNSASMTNGISAEQIRVTPDNNVAQVLKRVTGVTVQGDKFVTIRGVSDRYNNVLINGASLPSTEPNRRNFSFDIVPSALLSNVIVNKTATPDLPGEFTGGLAQINTMDVPLESFLSITIGAGFNTASAGKEFVSHKRDEKAWLGIVDRERKWFGDGRVFDPAVYIQAIHANDTAYRRKVSSQIPNHWQKYKYHYTPMQNYQLTGGISKQLKNEQSIGAIAAVTYRNEMLYEEGDLRVITNSDFYSWRYKYNTAIGALMNAGYKSKKHRFAWKNLFSHKYSNQFDEQGGAYMGQGSMVRRKSDITLTNTLLHTRLEGEHSIGKTGMKLDWYGDYIQQAREQPDSRLVTAGIGLAPNTMEEYHFVDNGFYTYTFNNPTITFNGMYGSVLKENRKNAGGNFSLPFTIAKSKQLFKAGYFWSERTADFDGTGLGISETGSYSSSVMGQPYHEIVSQEAFRSGQLYYLTAYARSSTTGDRYEGSQKLQAYYGMLDLRLLSKLRLTGGMRYEDNKMTLATIFYNTMGLAEFRDTVYREKDWLPSVNLIYSLTQKFNIRAAFSKTLARPDFVERSPYIYYDFAELCTVVGQNALQVTRIKNYDLRFEFYPSGTEIISASVFYKDFDKPVERFYNIGSGSNAVEYKNLYSATATGIEFEIRKSFSFVSPGSTWLQNLYFSANATVLKGEIKYLVTKSPYSYHDTLYIAEGGRPIQGLSPYILNGGLNYQGKKWGFNIGYNRFGRRIVNGGTDARLTQYENPRDVVDLQLSVRLFKQKAEFKLNISDLLNQDFIIYSNNINRGPTLPAGTQFPDPNTNNDPKGERYNKALDYVNYKVKKGTGISVSLTYKL